MLFSDDTRKMLSKTNKVHKWSQDYAEAVKLIKKDIREDRLSDAVVSETLDLQEREIPSQEEDNQKRSADVELYHQNKRLKVFYSKEQIRQYRQLARRFPSFERPDKQQPQDQQQDIEKQDQQQDEKQDQQRYDHQDQQLCDQQDEQHEIEITVPMQEDVPATSDSSTLNDPNTDDAMRYLQHTKKDLLEKIQNSVLSNDPEIVQLSKFNGNASDWNLNEQESKVFSQNAMETQEIARRFSKIEGRFKVIL